MDRLILLRHGKAEPDSASGDDFDRRLAPRGVRKSAAMGAQLADTGLPARRGPGLAGGADAATTWEAAERRVPAGARCAFDGDLYHADSGGHPARRAEAAGRDGCGTVMVVGAQSRACRS